MTEEQAEQIISLLSEILQELKVGGTIEDSIHNVESKLQDIEIQLIGLDTTISGLSLG